MKQRPHIPSNAACVESYPHSLLGQHIEIVAMSLQSGARPVMIVFDTKSRSRQKRRSKLRKPMTTSAPQRFAFISVSHPQNQDEDCRRLIKTHVMQHVQRQAEAIRAKSAAEVAIEVSTLEDQSFSELHVCREGGRISDPPRALLANVIDFPIQMRPYMLQLLHKCGHNETFYDKSVASAMLMSLSIGQTQY